jgi:ADP-heptose:LPS heptosyltransferase
VNLDALGDVLMTTALLPHVKTRYPDSTIRWITAPAAVPLLENNPLIDEIIPYSFESISYLQTMEFDLILSCDRDRKSTAITMNSPAIEKRGFGLGAHGNVIPLNKELAHLYRMGLDDNLKFRENKQTGQKLLIGGLGFEYHRTDYILELTDEEKKYVREYRASLCGTDHARLIGINTGCSEIFPNKKLRTEQLIELIRNILKDAQAEDIRILLLGGKSETELNFLIKSTINDPRIIETPTTEGIRKGLLYIAACDLCVSGDTFGAHAAIALKIPVIVLFTISCDTEIDLFDRGIKVLADVPCRPCWKKYCQNPYCLDKINLKEVSEAALGLIKLS